MLVVEYRWNKRSGLTRKSKKVGFTASRSTGSQSSFAKWKCATFPEDNNINDWVKVMMYDSVCLKVENSPQTNPRLEAAHKRMLIKTRARWLPWRHREYKKKWG